MVDSNRHLDTLAVHAGDPSPRIGGAVVPPIFQTANFEFSGDMEHGDLRYVRLNNTPTHDVLAARLAALEGGEAALVTGSGMAAITASILSVAGQGDHLLFSRLLYGGTRAFVEHELPRLGIEFDLIDPADRAGWRECLRPTTRGIYVETISNPTVRIPDLEAVVAVAREHGIVSMIDNTFASPVNFRPLDIGFDLCLHSATKYLNGHSDVAAGVAVGGEALLAAIRERMELLGATLDPHAAFLLLRGLATLGLRVRCQNENAMRLAEHLARHDATGPVHYPGLPDHPDHARAASLFDGYGGMLAFVAPGGGAGAERFMERLELIIPAPSLGGVHSLATRPSTTSHALLSPEARRAEGIPDGLVRLSVGIEAAEDLIEDVSNALE